MDFFPKKLYNKKVKKINKKKEGVESEYNIRRSL